MIKVGLTYDLRSDYLKEGYSEEETAEFDSEITISSVENTLNELGYKTQRIGNVKALIKALHEGNRWDLVFNIAEGMYGIGREAQVPALLDVYQIPYVFSDPLVLSLTLHKGLTKRVIRDCKIPTSNFIIVEKLSDLKSLNFSFPMFAKPVAEGTGKGIDSRSMVKTMVELESLCVELLERFIQPVLVEEYLPGREFTVGVVGTGDDARVIGAMEIIITERAKESTYSYHTKENWKGVVEYTMATGDIEKKCIEVALGAWRTLGCRDGGRVDLKMDANGIPNFIEVNPLAGINPEHSDLPMLAGKKGINFNQLIDMIMKSALKRIN